MARWDIGDAMAAFSKGAQDYANAADRSNGENLLVLEDQRVATAYMVEALRLFDHYEWRVLQHQAKNKAKPLVLHKPSRDKTEQPWWKEDWTDKRKAADRLLFS